MTFFRTNILWNNQRPFFFGGRVLAQSCFVHFFEMVKTLIVDHGFDRRQPLAMRGSFDSRLQRAKGLDSLLCDEFFRFVINLNRFRHN